MLSILLFIVTVFAVINGAWKVAALCVLGIIAVEVIDRAIN